jgi:pimeloyl-ACP methyl ester carboxylesterase
LPLVGELSVPTLVMPMGLITAPASLAKVFTPETPPESFTASPWRLALRTANFRANIRDLRRLRSSVAIVSPYYPRITAPVRLVHGTGDRVAYADFHSARFAKEVPHARVTFIPEAGHQVLYTHANSVAIELKNLLSQR